MAEAFARMSGLPVEAYSAGSRPSGTVNPKAIASMADIGYDLSTHESKGLAAIPQSGYDYAVTMGCGDECPMIDAANRQDWDIPDPKHMGPDDFRQVRDMIHQKVRDLLRAE